MPNSHSVSPPYSLAGMKGGDGGGGDGGGGEQGSQTPHERWQYPSVRVPATRSAQLFVFATCASHVLWVQ